MTYQYWKTNELQHSGVKGMKWGVRNVKQKIYTKLKNYKTVLKSRSRRNALIKNRHMMSDSGIDKYIIRLRKENELAKLHNQNVIATSPLKRFTTMLGESGSRTVSKALVSTGTAALVYAVFKEGKNSKNNFAKYLYEAINFGKQYGLGFGKKK